MGSSEGSASHTPLPSGGLAWGPVRVREGLSGEAMRTALAAGRVARAAGAHGVMHAAFDSLHLGECCLAFKNLD